MSVSSVSYSLPSATDAERSSRSHARALTAARPEAPRLVLWLLLADVAIGVLALANAGIARGFGSDGLSFFRLGMEANLPSWYSTVQLFLVAVVLSPLAVRDVRIRRPRTWPAAAPALFFLLLSLDEGAMVHERIGAWGQNALGLGADLLTGPWIFLVTPIYALLAVWIGISILPYVRGRRNVWTVGLFGAVLFAVSAAGFEALGNLTGIDDVMARRVLGVFEEVGEMVAASLLVWAALLLVRAEGVGVSLGPTRTPSAPGSA